jgi:NADH-quinone oxidoreductase subunit L
MFLAMGVGAFSAGIFHLYTHAFFKALMFLGSGAVIHALHGEQDMRRMGGLRKELPITYWTFLIGALAIAGVPGLAGFFSKDEILFRTFAGGHTLLWAVGVVTSLLTAIYMFRLVIMTFHGEASAAHAAGHGAAGHEPGGAHAHGHAGHATPAGAHGHLHDAPPPMAVPLLILAVGSVVAGYVGLPHALGGSNRIEQFLEPSFHSAALAGARAGEFAVGAEAEHETASGEAALHATPAGGEHAASTTTEIALMGVSSMVALAGIGLAVFFFGGGRRRADAVAAALPGVHRVLLDKYYVDEAYDAAIVHPIQRGSTSVLWKAVDAGLIDGMVNGTGALVRGGAAVIRLAQTGSVRAYAASLFAGVLLVLAYYLAR